ncbi:MAG: hypothetical protein HY519_00500 [Candidatus Aenigmarchaeota archaeon]|nr:hypothetical protein [Candidatus Aenigmarchaeota archaeon]
MPENKTMIGFGRRKSPARANPELPHWPSSAVPGDRRAKWPTEPPPEDEEARRGKAGSSQSRKIGRRKNQV